MKIIVDAMGGDQAPAAAVKGALAASQELGAEIILAGRCEELLKCLEDMGEKELPKKIEIAHAPDVITMEDEPSGAVRQKKDASMSVGLRLLREGAGEAFVSAGNTGALLSGATLLVKRLPGIRRAALAPTIPTKGGGSILIDAGANTECTPEYLLQFAYMGSFCAKHIKGIENPRVGLLNIGEEETKGTELQKKTYRLLAEAAERGGLHFIGNVEGREVIMGAADVVVCDGFTGNILLKAVEGAGLYFAGEIKGLFRRNVLTKLAALLVRDGLTQFRKKFDYSEVGGTALLGISKTVIKAHGASDARAIRNAVGQAMAFSSSGMIEDICQNIEYMKSEENAEE